MPLNRNTPLQRRTPLQRKTPLKRGKSLPRVSKKLKRRLEQNYYPVNNAFLRLPENRYCYICICRSRNLQLDEVREMMQNLTIKESDQWLTGIGARLRFSGEVHHWAGRCGALLTYVPYFVASCYGCREWPHAMPREARRLGLLAPANLYQRVTPEVRLFEFSTYLRRK